MSNKESSKTLEELLVEFMPFSKELVNWCNNRHEFRAALKNVYADKFISLGAIITSYSPNFPEDEVIGIYSYDYRRKNPLFKQDFIVNKEKKNEEFIIYTRNPNGSSKYIKDINEFLVTYGRGGYYKNSHHLSFEELPVGLQERGKQAIDLAEKVKNYDLKAIPQTQIDKVFEDLRETKKEGWVEKRKLNTKPS